jgi:hypothetical protein
MLRCAVGVYDAAKQICNKKRTPENYTVVQQVILSGLHGFTYADLLQPRSEGTSDKIFLDLLASGALIVAAYAQLRCWRQKREQKSSKGGPEMRGFWIFKSKKSPERTLAVKLAAAANLGKFINNIEQAYFKGDCNVSFPMNAVEIKALGNGGLQDVFDRLKGLLDCTLEGSSLKWTNSNIVNSRRPPGASA